MFDHINNIMFLDYIRVSGEVEHALLLLPLYIICTQNAVLFVQINPKKKQ